MKILVPIKRVVDYNVKVRPMADNSDVDLNNAKMSVNPFCEIALEEAVRIKEAGNAEEVIAVTVGKTQSQEQLRTALALGADRAILVESDSLLEPLAISKVLTKLAEGVLSPYEASVFLSFTLTVALAEVGRSFTPVTLIIIVAVSVVVPSDIVYVKLSGTVSPASSASAASWSAT